MRRIEIFTMGCQICEPVVRLVKGLACDSCEIIIYNRDEVPNEFYPKVDEYKIKHLPAVAVDGKLLSSTDYKELVKAGIGTPL